MSGDPRNVCEHREWAPTRKIDTNLDGDELRRRMANFTTGDDELQADERQVVIGLGQQLLSENRLPLLSDLLGNVSPKIDALKEEVDVVKDGLNATNLFLSGLHTLVAAYIVTENPDLADKLGLKLPDDVASKIKG